MEHLTSQDAPTYKELKRAATTSVVSFRSAARQSAEEYPRSMRRLINRASTRDTPAYLLLNEWFAKIAPEIEALSAARQAKPLSNALAKHLLMSKLAATDVAKNLVDRRIFNVNETFLNHCYGGGGRARSAATRLLNLPSEDISTIYDRYVEYHLYSLVAHDLGLTIYDPHASILKRAYQKVAERRQMNQHKKQQEKRLDVITTRQDEIRAYHNDIIARILSIDLDTKSVFGAYEQYKKRLDALKPTSRTPKKRLALFDTATKKIRKDLTDKQSKTEKISDLQNALQTIEDVLIELFDMSDAEHDTLLTYLKEYENLDREAARIHKQLTSAE